MTEYIDERQAVEEKYFKDITCCGLRITSLYKLIEHHERCHEQFEFCSNKTEAHVNMLRHHDVFFSAGVYINEAPYNNNQEIVAIDTSLLTQPTDMNNSLSGMCMKHMFVYVTNMSIDRGSDPERRRRYVCTEPLCNKVYKNINGLRYHQTHGHHKHLPISQLHVCKLCGKTYKASNGLRYHMRSMHTILLYDK